MKDKLFKNFGCYLILFISFFQVECRKMNDIQKKFIGSGEITYIAKADSIKVREGHNRIELSFLLLSDPKVASYKIYWNNHLDSIENVVHRTKEVDTIHVMLNNLKEGTYHFEIYTYDKNGNTSVEAVAVGRSYGDLYGSALLPRAYSNMKRDGNDLQIKWKESAVQEVRTELEYTDDSARLQKVIIPRLENTDTLKNFPKGGSFKIISAFLPDAMAIDTFYKATTISIPIVKQQLDKTTWNLVTTLPSDFFKPYSATSALTNLWDGLNNGPYAGTDRVKSTLPSSFTIDLGQEWRLAEMKGYQYLDPLGNHAFLFANLKRYEIWGSNKLSDNWDDWTLLLQCESIKPSGLPYGESTAEDKAYAAAGEDYSFPLNTPSVRYIRVKVLETWQNNNYFYFDEITLWGWGEQF